MSTNNVFPASAHGYGEFIYGNNQHPGPTGNLIQPVNDPAAWKGGRRTRTKTMMMPTVLLVSNTISCRKVKKSRGLRSTSRKTKKGGKSRKSRKNRR